MPSTRVLVVDNGSLSVVVLRRRLTELGADVDVVAHDRLPAKVRIHQAVVLSGTKIPADRGDYSPLIELVEACAVPVLGLCGGMHILGLAHGGELTMRNQRVGNHHVTVDTRDTLFSYVGPRVELFQRHTLYLTKVPHGFSVIGRSGECPIEFIRSTDGRMIGSQAHLEFRYHGLLILRRFLEICTTWQVP
jgi:GMP synthase (glutamine-hydrolysing)